MLCFYNSINRRKENFIPINPDLVRMYVCGPTVYDLPHLGNARPIIVFDILYRLLQYCFPKVLYVRNFTDIDDKIIKRAHERKISISDLTDSVIRDFHEDTDRLGVLRPDHEPKATDYVVGMVAMIQGLIEKKFAYVSENHVLFRVSEFNDYGKLSGLDPDQLEVGARVEVAPYKESPFDFVLWKPSSNDQPGWNSPWGIGRPGWHIECSVMSSALLGQKFDIHGGGIELIFPHHENEMAQSCAFHDSKILANFWIHNGHLMIKDEKMSKSLGNFITLRDLLKYFNGEVIRYAFLSTHYRQPLNFSEDSLNLAHNNLNKLYKAIEHFEDIEVGENLDEEFFMALCDDLNTPLALTILHKRIQEINKRKDISLIRKFKKSCQFIGLFQNSLKNWVQMDLKISEADILNLINQRDSAREKKDYMESDRIRDYLLAQGIILEDTKKGTVWRKI